MYSDYEYDGLAGLFGNALILNIAEGNDSENEDWEIKILILQGRRECKGICLQ